MNDIFEKINTLKKVIRETNYEELQNNVYVCFANGCLLLTSFLQKKGAPGWSANLVNEIGQPLLTSKEQKLVESIFEKCPWLLEEKEEQEGGFNSKLYANPPTHVGGGSETPILSTGSFIESTNPISLTGEDVSLDKLFQAFLNKTDEYDKFWNRFATESPGFAKILNGDQMIVVPGVPAPIPVPRKPLVIFLIAILDSFRISSAALGSNSYLLTLIVFMEELITGQWRQMIMTSLGFLSPSGVAIGVLLKYIINAWTLVNPSLRNQILNDLYKGMKSVIIGFLLWAASTLPPTIVKQPIEMAFSQLKLLTNQFESKIKTIEEQASRGLAPFGQQVKFTGLNLEKISKISLADIQNLQSLAQWDIIVCSKEFQEILETIKSEPIFRLLLELLGVPVVKEDILQVCKAGIQPISKTIETALQPVVLPINSPQQEGGHKKRNHKQRKQNYYENTKAPLYSNSKTKAPLYFSLEK